MFDESMHIDVTELLYFNEAEIKFVYPDAERAGARARAPNQSWLGASPAIGCPGKFASRTAP